MAVDLKLTEVSTGKIILADTVGGEVQEGSSFSIGGIQSMQSSADPYADVQRVVAAKISEAIVTSNIPIKVISIQKDGTLILNYGNVFLANGDHLILFEVGESFVDPDTGEVLGSDETEVGRIVVTIAETRFSRARVIGEQFEVHVGSVLKRPAIMEQPKQKNRKKRKRSGGELGKAKG